MALNERNLSEEAFVIKAIKELRKSPGSGINPKSSGFQDAFRKYFDEEPDPTLEQLSKNGIIRVEQTDAGKVISVAKDHAEKEVDELENTTDQELKQPSKGSNDLSLDHQLPLLIDEKGVHETTEHALTYSPDRAWLKECTEKANRIAFKAIYLDQEYFEETKDSAWVRKEKLWLIEPSDLDHVISHYRSKDYQVVLSPELSKIALSTLSLSINQLQDRLDEEEESGKNRDKGVGVVKDLVKTENGMGKSSANFDNEFSEGDVVEHFVGKRGKVERVYKNKLLVKIDKGRSQEWRTEDCKFIREGK